MFFTYEKHKRELLNKYFNLRFRSKVYKKALNNWYIMEKFKNLTNKDICRT